MRRRVSLTLLALFVAIVASFPASVGASEKEVHGTVLVPSNGAAKLQRCLELTAPGSAQGVGGWTLTPTPGRRFVLSADAGQHVADFDIVFYDSLARCEDAVSGAANYQRTGDEEGSVPEQARFAIVTMKNGVPGSAFTYTESEQRHPVPTSPLSPGNISKSFTVVAVIDDEFSPYHYDFAGHQHPWNKDADPRNNFDPYADPRTYLTGYPGSKPIELTLPKSSNQDTSLLAEETDQQKWQGMLRSDADRVNMYRFPGTKIIGAINFNQPYEGVDGSYPGNFYRTNDSHGTRSAASSSGNIHGTCPECLIVMISGFYHEAVAWAASQPWIDVVTNSWGESMVGFVLRDNISLNNPLSITKQASEAGQVITWSAGNGLLNAFDVPILTYWSSQKGPDWIVTVGAAEPGSEQQYSGAGKPVDISSIGSDYPSTGGATAGGEGFHSGTSNASPVVGGTFAKLIQRSRELLQDSSEGHRDGVVAEGRPLACGMADRQCPLGDGVLTRAELERVIYETALPAPLRPSVNSTWPSTGYAYYYQGHGVISGRSATPSKFEEEQRSFVDVLTGNAGPPNRPAGEENWFVIDSKCRQRLWGQWSGGIYQGVEPELDSMRDPVATQFDAWCSGISQDSFADLAHEFGYQNYIVPFVEDLPVAFTASPISSTPQTSKPRRPVRVRVIDASAAEEATRTPSIDEKAVPRKMVRAVRVLTEPVGYEPLQIAALLFLTLVTSGTAGFGVARKLGKVKPTP